MKSHSSWEGSRWGKKEWCISFLFLFCFCYLLFEGSWAALLYEQVTHVCEQVCTQPLQFAASGPCACFNLENPSLFLIQGQPQFENKVTLIFRNSAYNSNKTCNCICASSQHDFFFCPKSSHMCLIRVTVCDYPADKWPSFHWSTTLLYSFRDGFGL